MTGFQSYATVCLLLTYEMSIACRTISSPLDASLNPTVYTNTSPLFMVV